MELTEYWGVLFVELKRPTGTIVRYWFEKQQENRLDHVAEVHVEESTRRYVPEHDMRVPESVVGRLEEEGYHV